MILAEITKLVSRGPTGVEGEGEDWGKDREVFSSARNTGLLQSQPTARPHHPWHRVTRRERPVTQPRGSFCGSLCPLTDDLEVHLIYYFICFS